MPYLTLDPHDLQPGDRIPGLSTDGPTIAAVDRDGDRLLLRFEPSEEFDEDTREVDAGDGRMPLYVWRPDEQHPTADTEDDPARNVPAGNRRPEEPQ